MKQVTKEEFIELYVKMSISEMSKALGVSRNTINTYARSFNLEKKRKALIKDKK